MSKDYKIFWGSASQNLASKIVPHFTHEVGRVNLQRFSDGEFQPQFVESLRGKYVFIIQSTYAPSDNLMELLSMIDAAKRASAKDIIAVVPYFGFARQDRKDKPRVSLGAKLVANLLTVAGITRMVTLDLHADQIQGFFDVPVDNIFASAIFIKLIESMKLDHFVFASPDVGSTKRVSAYSKYFSQDFVVCYKQREKANSVEYIKLIGSVKGKNVIILDDIVDTAETLVKAAEAMKQEGANSVLAICSHPILSGESIKNIENSSISKLYVTDSIPLKKTSKKIEVISVAPLFADVIKRLTENRSISSLFIF